MALTFCDRCKDTVEEGCDPREELSEVDALLERFILKRYALKRKINQLYSPIVRHLPPDVTSTIFEFCLPDFTDRQLSPYTKEDISIPLSLGAICSYWRDIAWSTPSLWSSLVVCVTSKRDSHIVTGIAQEWLTRSGQLPLSINIFANTCNTTLTALADIINQHSTRWFNLDLFILPHCYQHFHATDNHAPILKYLRFHSCGIGNLMNLNLQLTCPRLERASLSMFPVGKTNIQWDNLTHLTLQSMSIIDSLLILRKTPRLVFLKLSGLHARYKGPNIGAFMLTSLRSLQLLSWNLAEDFLSNLIAPHLKVFYIPIKTFTSMENITFFLRRSACSLRSFSMIFSIFPPYFEGLMELLQSMPSLKKLSLSSTSFEDTTRENYDPRSILELVAKVLFSQSTSQQGFLPNLKILEYSGKLYLGPGNYVDFYSLPPVDNAVLGPFHLLKLDLNPATRIPINMISYLSSLVERGVTVKVISGSENILQSSIDYYRCREDSLHRDWTDNLDSSLIFLDFCVSLNE